MMDEAQGERPESADSHHKLDRKEAIFLAVIIALGLLLTFVQANSLILNSDHSQSALIFYDLQEERPHLLAGWYLPTNNYLLTDTTFYVITGSLFGMGPTTVRLTAWVIFLLGVLAAATIVNRAFSLKPALYSAAGMLFLPAIATGELLKPQNHNGNILFSLIAYLVASHCLDESEIARKDAIVLLPLLALVTTAGVFSDPTMLFTFSLPFVLTLITLSALKRELPASGAKTLTLIGLVILVSGGAILLQYAVSMNTELQLSRFLMQTNSIALEELSASLAFTSKILAILFGLMEKDGGFSIVNIARALLLVAAIASALLAFKNEKDARRQYFLVFLFVMGSLIAASFVFRAKPFELNTARYLIPVLYCQAVFVGIALSGYYRTHPSTLHRTLRGYRYVVLGAFALCIVLVGAGVATTAPARQKNLELAEFLEENGLDFGYSQFWYANIITLNSENRVKVRPIEFTKHGARPFFWSSNENWYSPDPDLGPSFLLVPEGTNDYGFSIVSPMMMQAMFGPPVRQLEYEGTRIYVWDKNILGIRR
ncbi:MAG TPA: hypothetical protein ENI12_00620 [Nitrospirae bacterium]|nr:hypothetical protein [Nitrospirota bacterium]